MERDLEFSGLSGCRFKLNEKGNVVKYARNDRKRIDDLKTSYAKSKIGYLNDSMCPIRVLNPISFKEEDSYFEVEMPLIKDVSQCSDTLIRSCCSYFMKERPIFSGFKLSSLKELNRIMSKNEGDLFCREINIMGREIADLINECSDNYPQSFFHGDFGMSNIIESKGVVYAIDLSPGYINSILVDVATLEMNTLEKDDWEVALSKSVSKFFKSYRQQIDIIRKLRILSFWKVSNTESTKITHRKMFYDE